MNIETLFYNRNYSQAGGQPPHCEAMRYSWSAMGGPDYAELRVVGNESQVWESIDLLRCPVELYDGRGRAVWWGYVHEAEIGLGGVTVGVSLDEMYNQVRVGYVRDVDGSATYTAYVTDTTSIATYGTKAFTETRSSSSDGLALEDATKILAVHKYPISTVQLDPGDARCEATLRCRGWYQTLGWANYAEAETANAAATTIAGSIVSGVGQFLTGTKVIDAGTIERSQYYEGDQTGLTCLEEVLAAGVDGGNRLLPSVLQSRVLQIEEEPDKGASTDYYLESDGRITGPWGIAVEPHTCPVGVWLKVSNVLPINATSAPIADPSYVFLERSEYEPATGRLTLEPRGKASPWDLVSDED